MSSIDDQATSEPDQAPQTLAQYLEEIAREVAQVLNERDPYFESARGQSVRNCIAPGFEATLDNYPGRMSWSELCEIWAQEHRDYPCCWLRVNNCQSHIDAHVGSARLWLEADMKFVDGVVAFKTVTQLRWHRDLKHVWTIKEFYMMRGGSL